MTHKKEKTKEYRIKEKLMKANNNYNDWKLRFHWNKIEWVDPKK